MIPDNVTFIDGGPPVTGDQLSTLVQTVATLDTARAFIGLDGMQMYLQGYSAPGDGGQGPFYWNAAGTGPDDGGVSNIVPYGAVLGCWTRMGSSPGSTSIVFAADLTASPALTLTPGAATTIIFDSLNFQFGSGYTPSSGIYQPTVPGTYLISATIKFQGTTLAGSGTSLAIFRNSVASRSVAGQPLPAIASLSGMGSLTVTGLFRMNGTTDTLYVGAAGPGMLSCFADGGNTESYISGAWLGP